MTRRFEGLPLAGILVLAVLAADLASAESRGAPEGPFPDTSLKGWKERSFKGNTSYSLVDDGGLKVLQGKTRGQASVLYREVPINLDSTPWLRWSWKIDTTYGADTDEQSREGDDFPARLYVVVKTGLFPWQTLAINYVWSSSTPTGTIWRNPFTGKAGMIAVRSGERDVGQWVSQKRNVMDDFRAVFGENVKSIDGYAVMVDGDNSGASATGWFGNIDFSAR